MFKQLSVMLISSLLITISSLAFSGGYHGSHGKHVMDFDAMQDGMSLSIEQQNVLSQIEASHLMIQNMMVNIRANSLDDNGNVDRSAMRSQWEENSLVVDEHNALWMDFKASLSEDQMDAWKAMIMEQKKSCKEKRY
jgi:hypothetical protein